MRVIYHHPDYCHEERRYVVGWLVEEVFGWDLSCQVAGRNDQQFMVEGEKGSLTLPDTFFALAKENWLGKETLPENPLPRSEGLPKLYGTENEIDFIGSLFFLISRYEEPVIEERDEHGRVPGSATVLGREGLLHRAIGNEYIELLWELMRSVWPGISRKERSFRVLPSHDVDLPSKCWAPWGRTLRGALHKMKTGRSGLGARQLGARLGYRWWIKWEDDPWDTITWLADQSEASGWQSTFYYIAERTHERFDPPMPIEHPHVADQWKRIGSAGHQLGLHPGYETYQRPGLIVSAARKLRAQMEKLGIEQSEIGGRQHYLRWCSPQTARGYDAAGLVHDSTLGFADRPGFRAGVCFEYPWYDVVNRCRLKVRERPLVLMDKALLQHRDIDDQACRSREEIARELKEECRRYGGDFTVLWHNSQLENEEARELYRHILNC